MAKSASAARRCHSPPESARGLAASITLRRTAGGTSEETYRVPKYASVNAHNRYGAASALIFDPASSCQNRSAARGSGIALIPPVSSAMASSLSAVERKARKAFARSSQTSQGSTFTAVCSSSGFARTVFWRTGTDSLAFPSGASRTAAAARSFGASAPSIFSSTGTIRAVHFGRFRPA